MTDADEKYIEALLRENGIVRLAAHKPGCFCAVCEWYTRAASALREAIRDMANRRSWRDIRRLLRAGTNEKVVPQVDRLEEL